MVAEDMVEEHAWQLNQEFRLASNFSGPLNFSVGGNFMHYETEENYFVFFNTLSLYCAKFNLHYRPIRPERVASCGQKPLDPALQVGPAMGAVGSIPVPSMIWIIRATIIS